MKSVAHGVQALVIAVGGGVGALSRYYLSLWVQMSLRTDFPYGILLVNALGCFLMGFLACCLLAQLAWSELLRAGLLIGLLGGFTTFSSFSLDNFKLLQQGSYFAAAMNILLSVFGGLLLTLLGWHIGRLCFAR